MDPDIALALRAYGVEISTTADQGLRAADDDEHFAFAHAEGRVIVTDDIDFLRIASLTTDHPGVVFCRRSKHTIGEIIQFLLLIHGVYAPDEMPGRVEYL